MKYIIILTLSFLIQNNLPAQKNDSLTDSIIVLSNSEDYSKMDLYKLKNLLQNKKVVMLGEQSHGDGTTFEIKTEIVKYLHARLGFDIIAFESGFYDCMKVDERIETGNDPIEAARLGIFKIWSKSTQTKKLFNYIAQQSKSKHPLKLVGFDCQPTGQYSRDSMLYDLSRYLGAVNPQYLNSDNWNSFKLGVEKIYTRDEDKFKLIGVDSFSVLCKRLIKIIEGVELKNKKYRSKQTFWIQTIKNVEVYSKFAFSQSLSLLAQRDIQMADNILWLLNNYPGKRVILWGATAHFIRSPKLLSGNSYDNNTIERMGNVLYREMGNAVFSIGFTAYAGSCLNIGTKKTYMLLSPSKGSLEDLLSRTPGEILFVDYQNSNSAILKKLGVKFISRPLGNAEKAGNWTDCLDGIIFIRNSKPSILEN